MCVRSGVAAPTRPARLDFYHPTESASSLDSPPRRGMQFVMRRRQDLAVDYDVRGPASFTSNAVFGKHTLTYGEP